MGALYEYAFQPVVSTGPGFNSTLDSSGIFKLESSGIRSWQFPTSRAVRVASMGSDDFSLIFGTSLVVYSTAVGTLVLGGTVELFRVTPSQSYVALQSSTDVAVNFTLGYGQ